MQGSVILKSSVLLLAANLMAEPVWERSGVLPAAAQAERRFSAARWLWRNEFPTAVGSECLFRRTFDLPAPARSAKFSCRTDDFGWIYLNGCEIRIDRFAANLRAGRNVLAVKVKNGANVAGLLFAADIVCADGAKVRIVSDTATRVAASAADGWQMPDFDDAAWEPASDQGDVLQIPWSGRCDYTADYATEAERAAIAAERRRIPALPATLAYEPDLQASLVQEGHRVKIRINGRTYEPDINLFNVGGLGNKFAKDCLLKTYAMGWRLFELPVNPSEYELGGGRYDFTCVEKAVSELLTLAPEAYVSFSLNLDLPKWCAEHPDETIRYADPQKDIKNAGDEFNGVPVRPSAASRPYRTEVAKVIRLLGERIAAGTWGKRVAIVRTDWGVYTEWHMFGMKNAPDVSRPMVESFGRNPPPVEVRRRERRILDEKEDAELIAWNFHQQNEVADALIAFTSAVKKYIPGRLAGAYYGYIWDIFWPEGSNCLLGKVLDAPSVDFLSAPSPYFGSVRFGGGSYHSRSIPDAFRRRGKLFMCEDDSRHYHTKGWAFERHLVATPELSAAVMKRNYLNKIFDGGGIQFCDPFYGVGLRMSTFDDPVVLRALKEAMDVTAKAGDVPSGLFADVLVVVSERERLMRDSHVETPGQPNMHWRNLYSYLPDHLYRSGFSVEFIRLEDYLTDRTKPKAVVLLNLYHLSAAERTKLSERVAGTKVVDCAKETVPATAADWRTRLERAGAVPSAPLDTYFRRQGDLFLFHTGVAGTVTVRPGIAGAAEFVELFTNRRYPGGETVEITTDGPTTLLFRACKPASDVYLPPYRAHDWRAGWIWHGKPLGTRYFRKTVDCKPDELRLAAAQWAADDRSELFVNGTSVGVTTSWSRPTVREDLLQLLKDGTNEILIRAENDGSSAGLMAEIDLLKKSGEVVKVGTGTDWQGGDSPSGPWSPVREFMRLPQPPYGETPYVDYETGTRTQTFAVDLGTEPVPQAGRLVTSIRREDGAFHYFENGVERPFITYRSPSAGTWRGGRHQFLAGLDRAGVRLAEISIPLGPAYWREDGSLDEAGLERELLSAFHCTSNMNLICFFNVDAPAWYVKAHAADRYAFADGKVIDRMSYASEAYRRDATAFLRRTVAYLRSRPYYGRIAGFGLDGGYDGQFMQWTDYGYRAMGDYSEPMRRLFGAELPSAARRRGSAENLRLDPVRDADVIRYNRLFGATPAAFMLACARAIKEASANEKVVCAYYGKFYSLAGYLEAGELSIRRVLASPYVDALVAVEYNQRAAGMPHSISAPTESYALHGKLFVDEADIRTFLDGQKNWGYAGDEKGTESMIRKMFAMSFVRGHAIHWYDLFGGWFAHPAIERMIADVQRVAVRHMRDAVRPAEIAVVCDEESMIKSTSAIKRETARTTNHLQNGVLGRIGAPFDLYFADDLAAAPSYRLYVFLNCFAPTPAAQTEIDRIRASGAACVFVNPGDRVPTPAEYRARVRQAGVHLVSEADDVMVYVGRGLLGVHAGSAGAKTLAWPEKATFRDAITHETVAADVTRFTLPMAKGETRLLDVCP